MVVLMLAPGSRFLAALGAMDPAARMGDRPRPRRVSAYIDPGSVPWKANMGELGDAAAGCGMYGSYSSSTRGATYPVALAWAACWLVDTEGEPRGEREGSSSASPYRSRASCDMLRGTRAPRPRACECELGDGAGTSACEGEGTGDGWGWDVCLRGIPGRELLARGSGTLSPAPVAATCCCLMTLPSGIESMRTTLPPSDLTESARSADGGRGCCERLWRSSYTLRPGASGDGRLSALSLAGEGIL